jgi:hypothetical protein
MNIKSFLTLAALGPLTLGAGAAQAQAGTGSLAGWAVYGDAAAQAGTLTLTTAYLDGAGDQPFNLSGSSAVDIGTLEAAAGVAPFALDLSASEYATEGSLVSQTFSAAAGQMLSFNWAFGGNETLFEDHAFVVLNGQVFTLASLSAPGLAGQNLSLLLAPAGGLQTLSFGVVDTVDVLGVSTLSISALQVSAVPEPGSVALLLAGLGLVGAAARRSQAVR